MLETLPMKFSRPVSLEDALGEVGTGQFQYMMLAICGLANAADAVEIMSVGLLGTAAEHDLQLTPERQGALNACIFVGMFLGGLFWGQLGDIIGRKQSLLLALLVNAAFGLLTAASHNLGTLMALRLLAGLGVGGSMPVVFAQMSEFCPPDTRGKLLALLASCWMVGSMYSALMGWLVIPAAGWRAFVAAASLPAWVCAFLIWWLMPESPRYLAVAGRGKEAAQVLQHMADVNGRTLPEDFCLAPIPHPKMQQALLRIGSSRIASSSDLGPSGCTGGRPWHVAAWQESCAAGRRVAGVFRLLLFSRLRIYTWPLAVAWIGLCGGWYCTMLWLPKYFEQRGAKGSSIYMQTFIVALANLPGNIASVYLVDWLGRRVTACACMAGACLCALLFAAAPANGIWPTLAACVFNAVSVGGWNSLDMISSELYPTPLRSSGFGLLNATGRVSSFITNIAAGALMGVRLWAPLVAAAGLLAAGSVAMMVLPEPAGKPLEDGMASDADAEGSWALDEDSEVASTEPSHHDASGRAVVMGLGPAARAETVGLLSATQR